MKSEIDGFVETQDELDNIIPQDNEDMMRMGKIQQFKVVAYHSCLSNNYFDLNTD